MKIFSEICSLTCRKFRKLRSWQLSELRFLPKKNIVYVSVCTYVRLSCMLHIYNLRCTCNRAYIHAGAAYMYICWPNITMLIQKKPCFRQNSFISYFNTLSSYYDYTILSIYIPTSSYFIKTQKKSTARLEKNIIYHFLVVKSAWLDRVNIVLDCLRWINDF